MSFGENLQFLRKNEGITQEELAERLEVSRQSVSKWESDNAFPEMDKIIQLSNMFGCSVDSLLKGEVKSEVTSDAWGYDKHMNNFANLIAYGIGVILFGVTLSAFFGNLEGKIADTLTAVSTLLFAMIGTVIIIVAGINHGSFKEENPHINNFYTPKQIKDFNRKFAVMISIGIAVIMFGFIITVVIDAFDIKYKDALMGSSFMFCVAVGTVILVKYGMLKDKYDIDKYNKEVVHDKHPSKYGKIHAIVWLTAIFGYIISGFIGGKIMWNYGWIIFIVAAFISAVLGVVEDKSEK